MNGGMGELTVMDTQDKKKKLQLWLKRTGFTDEWASEWFSGGWIERVEVMQERKSWRILIGLSKIIPLETYIDFYKRIQEAHSDLDALHVQLCYGDDVSDQNLVDMYWDAFIPWIQKQAASVNGWLSNAEVQADSGKVTISLRDETVLQIARKKQVDACVQTYFETYFGRDFRVELTAGTSGQEHYETFAKKIEEEERTLTSELMQQAEASHDETGKAVPFKIGTEIREQPTPIQHIQEEEKRLAIEGSVFALDMKELRNGTTLYQFNVTDYADSITVKSFVKNKEDLKIYKQLKDGMNVKLRGRVEYDRFTNPPELTMIMMDGSEIPAIIERKDESEQKRVEFHLHTAMSAMDGIASIDQYVKTAAAWGHEAIAVTDHGNVQCYPDASKAAKKHGIKMIYGLEANIVNDAVPIVMNATDTALKDASYVVFDIETTGLSVTSNKIIEIGAVKMKEGKEVERFSTFINPHEAIPYNITQLTSITDDMVKDAPDLEQELPKFIDFARDSVLVAHNARFDIGFIQEFCRRLGLPPLEQPVLDTLELARLLLPGLKNHRLNTLAKKYKASLENHHRAIDDSIALGHILFHLLQDGENQDITNLQQLVDLTGKTLKNTRPFHSCIYAKDEIGKKNLYKLVSLSSTTYFHRVPCIPKSLLQEYREGLILLSGCEQGELFETVLNKSEEEAERTAKFYDVLEIQPVGHYMHLVDKGLVRDKSRIEEALRRICDIGVKLGIPVVATGNVHYLEPKDKICRDIVIHGITGYSPLKDIRKPDVHFRTTKEMLNEFRFLGEQKSLEVVVSNTKQLAEQFEEIKLFPTTGGPTDNGLFSPIIEGSDQEIRNKCFARAEEIYGDPIPEIVVKRLEKELKPIIEFGYSANYLISERLVKKSNEDGYLVGSRGSVGSSVVAMMLGISEVNPLMPHYICGSCKHSEWFTDGSVASGFDLADKPCPKCGDGMKGDGQDIPFETFLGFKGDKVPDIDLNFSGDYQPIAHNYTKVLFSEKSVFRAGTIGTVAEKTAYGFVKKYEEEQGAKWRNAEISRLALGCTGVKRNTGQHPGGIVVVPDYMEVEDITPVQFPADDVKSEWMTTHFDYHAFEANLLKLDILGHDDPTIMRMLQDLTGVDPTKIPMNDPKVMSLFHSTEALGVDGSQIKSKVATYGVPDFGTKFVRQMLEETKPNAFSDLLQISGLSHGTGVWLGNAQELIKDGTCSIKTVIGCRDNIMLYLIYQAEMDAALAFKITESVRKGRGLTDEWKQLMREHQVPKWYIDSCERIEYMFPRAHASAYVVSAVRTAYFKLYHPIEFYATYFTVRPDEFDLEIFARGYDAILQKYNEINDMGFQASAKEKSMLSVLEMGLEMTARGYSFKTIDLLKSDATRFLIEGNCLIPPFSVIQGIGGNAAKNIAAAKEEGDFLSIEDFQKRARVSKTVIEVLSELGCFRNLPDSNQLSLF